MIHNASRTTIQNHLSILSGELSPGRNSGPPFDFAHASCLAESNRTCTRLQILHLYQVNQHPLKSKNGHQDPAEGNPRRLVAFGS